MWRSVSPATSFLRSGLSLREQAAAVWFGPKGFASVVHGLLVLESGIVAADEVFHLVALTIVISILAHSSTDVVIARAFDDTRDTPNWQGLLRRARRSAVVSRPGGSGVDGRPAEGQANAK